MPKRYPRYSIEFYADKEGRKPVLVWIEKKLTPAQRQAITIAMDEVLAHEGINVVGSEFGKTTSKTAITEFRVRQDAHELASRLEARAAARATSEGDAETRSGRGGGGSDQQSAEASPPARRKRGERVFLRVFFHAYGDKVVLLLAGYDKGRSPGKRHENEIIEQAASRLRDWRTRQQRERKASKRATGGKAKADRRKRRS